MNFVMSRTLGRLLVAVSFTLSLLVAPAGCEQPRAALAFLPSGAAVFRPGCAQARLPRSHTASRCPHDRRRLPPMRCAVEGSDGYAGGFDQQGGLSEQAALGPAGSGYPIPALGRVVIADLELNVPRRAGKRSLGAEGLLGSNEPQIQSEAAASAAGMKPTAGVGALMGMMAGGPFGAVLGAAASVLASRKDNMAGATVRTAAKAAGTMWGMGSEVVGKVEGGAVGDVFKTGLREVEKVVDSLDDGRSRGDKKAR